jgi:signal transduction histidine kinase
MSKIRATYDLCLDIIGPSVILETEPIKNAYFELKNRGVKIRMITEVTKDNLHYCKELTQVVSQVRHLDGVKGNFAITDTEYMSYAISKEVRPSSFRQIVRSTSKEFVEQQQHFFHMLWDKAVSAERKIMELESGIMLPERTEIITGADNILRLTLGSVAHTRESMDNCIDSNAPASFVLFEPMWNHIKEITSPKRGVRFRFITEITKDNLPYCKEMAKILELRHLDGIKGNLGIMDGREYRASPSIKPGIPPDVLIRSTAKVFVEQQQFFFETLCNKAIPAEQRIKEIEEGKPPEKLEFIQDTHESISRAFDIMSKTQGELLVLFATPRTFTLALQAGAADIYRKISKNGVNIKLLVPRGGGSAAETEENNDKQVAKVREEISPSINLRYSDVTLNTRITIMISDRNEFMSWELRDDTLNDPYLAGGIATYSNIKSLANSYATIFDNLWKITELAENLRLANIKLEGSEKAMKEFINIAAHELRTPLQPILGLSEMLSPLASNTDDPQQQSKLIDVIVRNAHKLENLAEDILDVTRIESGRLKLTTKKIDLCELVESIVHDFQRFLPEDGKVTMNYQKLSDDHSDEGNDRTSHLAIIGDHERIAQVLSNLLRNALKFTKEGTINVRVGRNESSNSYSEATVSISDSGQGIDAEVMHKLFEKFVSKSEKGTGLGLFISKSIVEAHGGRIWGENNKDGKGATFAFTLPLAT